MTWQCAGRHCHVLYCDNHHPQRVNVSYVVRCVGLIATRIYLQKRVHIFVYVRVCFKVLVYVSRYSMNVQYMLM